MRWHSDPTVLRFDVRPSEKLPAGWYRFISAPGLRALDVTAYGKLTAWADGVPCIVTPGARRGDGAIEYRVAMASRLPKAVSVALRSFLTSKSLADLGHEFGRKAPNQFIRDAENWFQQRRSERTKSHRSESRNDRSQRQSCSSSNQCNYQPKNKEKSHD